MLLPPPPGSDQCCLQPVGEESQNLDPCGEEQPEPPVTIWKYYFDYSKGIIFQSVLLSNFSRKNEITLPNCNTEKQQSWQSD